jgi:hypothetical protein
LSVLALCAPADSGAVPAGHARHKHSRSKTADKKKQARKRARAQRKRKRRPARRPVASTSPPVSNPLPLPALTPAPTPAPSQDPAPAPASDSSGGGGGGGGATPQATPTPSPTPSPTPVATPDPRPFSPYSFWNAPLSADAPLDDRSDTYVARLQQLVDTNGSYVNTTRFSSPVYTVPANQRTVRVTLDQNVPALQAAFEQVPIPDGAQPAAGSDGTMIVWQPSTDTMWEFWIARNLKDGWHAMYGGKISNLSRNPGYYQAPNSRWGATATSIPFLGGLMRMDELASGRIDHALAMALPELRAGWYSWPAQRSDGSSTDPDSIPEGVRFRIDPKIDLNTIRMAPIVRVMARAAQKYGIVVRDGGGAVAFYGEDPTPTGSNPYAGPNGYFGGAYINVLLRDQFPWSHLQVLKTQMAYDTR